jgi:heme-degrading monooxygenase HmoA
MMVVVFRARRAPAGVGEEYQYWFTRMTELARDMPGYISHKAYVADDGERLTLFEWESADTLHISGRARQTMH